MAVRRLQEYRRQKEGDKEMMDVLNRYLRVIDPGWVLDMDRLACQLIDEGWEVDCYDLSGTKRKCYFVRNEKVRYIVAPAKSWWRRLIG